MAPTQNIDALVKSVIMTDDLSTKQKLVGEIHTAAKAQGIFLSSIHDVYMARGKGQGKLFTTPAMNLRTMTYDLARAVFRVAKRTNAGAFIFEIAKSEMGYTGQPPIEYTGVVLAAAIKEGFSGPVFIQGDHCQIKAVSYFENKAKEVGALKDLVQDAIAGGFYNIDIDSSTTVKLDRPNLTEQQRDNFEICAELTKFIRKIQPKGIMVSIGGEIGEVGGKNSDVHELKAFMDGYVASLGGAVRISKISVQTGTSHGGVVLPDGTIAKVKVDFDALRDLSKFAKEKYSLGGAVQHGASTLPDEAFNTFAEIGTIEIHLATNFQNMVLDSKKIPEELCKKIVEWTKANCASERKSSDTEEQFIYKSRKKALGPFKKEIMGLPDSVRDAIAADIEKNFEFLFRKLSVNDTRAFVNNVIKPVDIELGVDREAAAVLDGEGDD